MTVLKQWFFFQFVHWHGFLWLPQVRLRHSFHHHPEHGLGQYLDLLLSGILNKISNRCLEHLEVLSSLFKRWCHRVLHWQRQPWPCSASPSSSLTLCRLDLWWHDMNRFNFLSTQYLWWRDMMGLDFRSTQFYVVMDILGPNVIRPNVSSERFCHFHL